MDFGYPTEKFSDAKRMLNKPNPRDLIETIVMAMHECKLGLTHVKDEHLDDIAKADLTTLRKLMDTTGLQDPSGKRGLWAIKAEKFSSAEIEALRNSVGALAGWFAAKLQERRR